MQGPVEMLGDGLEGFVGAEQVFQRVRFLRCPGIVPERHFAQRLRRVPRSARHEGGQFNDIEVVMRER